MLDVPEISNSLSLEFSIKKSQCIAIVKISNVSISPMSLGYSVEWTQANPNFISYCNECGTVASLHLDEQDVFLVQRFR